MRPDRRWTGTALAVVAVLAPGALSGQAVLLRYRPPVGHQVRTVSTVTIGMTFRDVVGEGVIPEGTAGMSFEADVVQSVTDRVLAVDGDVTLDRTVDSTRVALRALGIAQSEPADPRLRATAQVRVSDRLRLLGVSGDGVDTLPDVVTSALRNPMGYEVILPEDAVEPGDEWGGTIRFPFQNPGDGAGPALDTTLVAQATFQLDSVVAGSGDMLAYIGFRGQFQPITIEEERGGVGGVGTMTGGVAGTLIWSTGWNAFGSGALHAVLEMRLDVHSQGRHAGVTIAFDVVNRFEIRP